MLSGCETSSRLAAEDACKTDAVSIECLLKQADAAHISTEDLFARSSGAAELAVAYDTAGRPSRAAALIERSIVDARSIYDKKKRGAALSEIMAALADMNAAPQADSWINSVNQESNSLEVSKKADIIAKAMVARAVHQSAVAALDGAIALPETDGFEANAKAVALRKIAKVLAEKGDFDNARRGIDAITMSITYYQAMVRSDVARLAAKAGRIEFAKTLLNEADPIARAQDNGYFIGAALRDIGYSYYAMGKKTPALAYFEEASHAAAKADKQNEKARAVSRIATRLSDAGLYDQAAQYIVQSIELADPIEQEMSKGYTLYEIAGAASFAGDFATARQLIEEISDTPLGSTSSIKNAALRDLAWGLSRHGEVDEAIEVVKVIGTQREKIHALSRIIRLLADPEMDALPRYL